MRGPRDALERDGAGCPSTVTALALAGAVCAHVVAAVVAFVVVPAAGSPAKVIPERTGAKVDGCTRSGD